MCSCCRIWIEPKRPSRIPAIFQREMTEKAVSPFSKGFGEEKKEIFFFLISGMGNRFSKIGITCFSSFKDYLKAKILFYFIFSFLILKYLTNVMMPQLA